MIAVGHGTDCLASEQESGLSQGGGAAVTNQVEGVGYSVELYDGTNGLPTSDANVILSTSDGFIWIGNYSGLIRYDGTSFERQTDYADVTNVNTLYEDSRGYLWVGTNDNGIVAIHREKIWHFDYTDGLETSSIKSITEDADGNVIVGTTQGLYYVDTAMKIHKLDDSMLNEQYILRLTADQDGTIYGNARNGLIFCIKALRVEACLNGNELGIGSIMTVFPDPDNRDMIYLGTDASSVGYGSFSSHFKDIKIIPIRDDGQDAAGEKDVAASQKPINWISYETGNIWVVRDDLVGWLDEKESFHAIHNLPLNSAIGLVTEDYEGNLWFSSTRQGIMKIVANKFSDITERNALGTEVVNATCLHDGKLYIGTDTGLQVIDEKKKMVTDKLTKYIGEARVRCIMEDQDKNLWISTYTHEKGLVCFLADGSIRNYSEKNGLVSNQIRATALAGDGSVLAATNGGLVVLKDGEIARTIGADDGIHNTVILSVVEGDKDGVYYLGTDGDGIYVVDGNTITHKGREDGLTSDVILRIKKDEKRGVYWIITSNSIQYIKDGKIEKVEGFPYSNNYDIYFDKGDNAWILASNGFYVTKAQDMIDKSSFEYLLYDYNSGLPSMATVNAYSAMDEDGLLYVSGRSGVFTVNINDYFELSHKIKMCVPYVEAGGVRYYPDEDNTIRLPSSADAVTIYGYAITYAMQNPKICYQLEGVDKKGTYVFKQDMRPVNYTNLHGGTYTWKMSVENISTGSIQQTEELVIVKERALYEVWWFILLCVLAIIFVAEECVRFHMKRKFRRLIKKQEEDKRLIREIVEAFAKTIDMKDEYTKGHSTRVAKYTVMLARELGYDEETVEKYYNIALLHDIGKIGIPVEVLNKQGKLTDTEFKIIKSHSALGYNVLKDISIMPELAIGAGAHHERPDGKGYPKGLTGDQIPRVAQIIAVADTFDAMYSDRPYRNRMNFEKVVSIIREVSGTQLESDVVDAFLRLVEKGEFRDPDDNGGGSMESIDNIRKKYGEESGES